MLKIMLTVFTMATGCASIPLMPKKRISNNEHCTRPYIVKVYEPSGSKRYFCRIVTPDFGLECIDQEWTYYIEEDYNSHSYYMVNWKNLLVEAREDLDCLPFPKIMP